MYSVVVYSESEEAHATLREVAVGHRLLTASCCLTELIATLRVCGPTSALLVMLADASDFVLPAIRTTREQFPSLPIVGVVRWPGDIPHVMDAVRAGLDDLLQIPGGNLAESIARACAARTQSQTSRSATELARLHVRASARPLVETAIRLARSAPTVSEFAFAMGLSKRTLGRRLARENLPHAAELLAWARCLVAAVMLENEGAKVDSVARELRFPSSVALRRTLRRLTGLRPRQIRGHGGSAPVAKAINDLPMRGGQLSKQKAS